MSPAKYEPTELEKLLEIKSAAIRKKLAQFWKFSPGKAKFKKMGHIKQARLLMAFVKPLFPEEIDAIIKEHGTLPKDVHIYDADPFKTMDDLLERNVGRCIMLSILYKIMAQHIGIHDKNTGHDCRFALSRKETPAHMFIHFYFPREMHIFDPTSGTFDKRPAKDWVESYEPSIEATDLEIAQWVVALEASPSKKELELLNGLGEKFKDTALFWYRKGQALSRLGRKKEALKCFNKIIDEIDGNDPNAWAMKGSVIEGMGGSIESVIKCYDKAISIDPKDSVAWFNKYSALARSGEALEKAGDHKSSRENFRRALRCLDKLTVEISQDDPFMWEAKGDLLLKLEKYLNAVACYDKAIRLEPDNESLWLGKGMALVGCKDLDGAIKCFCTAKETEPACFMAWIAHAEALHKLGDVNAAIEVIEGAIKLLENEKAELLEEPEEEGLGSAFYTKVFEAELKKAHMFREKLLTEQKGK